MFEIGASLREARTNHGLSHEDVQQKLRIRTRYLTALEEERWELLPGEAYTKGFLRTYAEFLGLNGTLYIDEYNERVAAHAEAQITPESLAPRRGRSGLLTRTIVGIVVLGVLVFAANAWHPGSSATPRVDSAAAAAPKPATPKRHAAGKQIASVAPVVRPTAPARTTPIARIRAVTTRSWLSIRLDGAGGREVFRGFLNRGHSLTYRLDRKVWLRIGRPHALAIRIGDRLVRGLPGTPANLLLTKTGPLAG